MHIVTDSIRGNTPKVYLAGSVGTEDGRSNIQSSKKGREIRNCWKFSPLQREDTYNDNP